MPVIQTSFSRTPRIPEALNGLAVVAVSAGGRNYGLYRVKHAEERTMVLGHGAISFPVGMHLEVEDYQYTAPKSASFNQHATVVENGSGGIRLVW